MATAQEVIGCQEAVRQVHVDEKVSRYIVEIIQATRAHPDLSLGGSPRASMALLRCAQSFAAMTALILSCRMMSNKLPATSWGIA